jgi:branched-chain amino acid transport system substrate-binding protein
VQLLALPLDADTSMKMEAHDQLHEGPARHQEGLPAEPELLARRAGGEVTPRRTIARKRPDIQIVGEDLHPLAQVRDFAPYIAKIKASGADTVITGNWGSDLSLLVKAANEGGYNGKFYTYYTGVTGTPTALGTNGAGRGARWPTATTTWAASRGLA